MIRAAGILFLEPGGTALFLRRSNTALDHAGEWCFPGGQAEDEDKDLADTAIRETLEESGRTVKLSEMAELTHSVALASPADPSSPVVGPPAVGEDVDFTTFLTRVDEQFNPTLNPEHDGFCWAPTTAPPEPLHPGCRVALERLTMDELGVAQAMAAGRLTSPQRYMNVTLWNMRITGTGMAYRDTIDEYVWREPDIYMNDEFAARCNGLLVIMQHPKERATVDSKEFNDRTVGSIFLPYLKHDTQEVWGIAKVYDDAANELMAGMDLSTSPGVVLGSPDDERINIDGKALLIEGKPRLLDHIAICEQGVWDKKGPPVGIINNGGTTVADETKTEEMKDAGRADADAGEKLDVLLTKLDAACARMDAMEEREKSRDDAARKDEDEKEEEKKDAAEVSGTEQGKADADEEKKDPPAAFDKGKKDSEEEEAKEKVVDKARKDAEEKEKEEARQDAASLRRDINELRGHIKDLVKAQPLARTDDERLTLVNEQARADEAYSRLGKNAPRWMDGETADAYAVRLTRGLQTYSPRWKDANLHTIAADKGAWATAQNQIYADAAAFSDHPTDLGDGELREVTVPDVTGRRITSFRGEPRAWLGQFGGTPRQISRIRNNSAN